MGVDTLDFHRAVEGRQYRRVPLLLFHTSVRFLRIVQPTRMRELRGAPPKSPRILVCRGDPHSRKLHFIISFCFLYRFTLYES